MEWIEQRDGTLVDYPFVRAYFNPPARYVEFVMDYLRTHSLLPEIAAHLQQLED